ncbi:hypothetical protein ACJMK2_025556 [Sinanodonta woodiana]|uniref:Alpha-1,3-mannosyl-glycoprotein 2-beta-N-acetylglucosaminyltransferase n=1 Tax=Sinanodonta woodiana TaxID=1069815 RepID=A0ABD3XKH4_SINWO
MKRKHLVTIVVVVFLSWNAIMYYTLVSRTSGKLGGTDVKIKLNELQEVIQSQLQENDYILKNLQKLKDQAEESKAVVAQIKADANPVHGEIGNHSRAQGDVDGVVIPILMIACDRTEVSRSLDQVLKYRPDPKHFPVIVSQDCGHKETAQTIQTYVDKYNVQHIQQPDLSDLKLPWPQKKFMGYYKIARHYKWALNQVFHTFNYSAVIIVEDDLDISPDFYEYFAATFRILNSDPSLWCVSAWNDNGKKGNVKEEPELLHRTDFFPGLGWMLTRELWLELGPKWPETFWDDWMRHPDQRKGRSCIRPEICRTSTFGKQGVSKGLFYEKHLKFIQLNEKSVPFTKMDLSYLKKDVYDPVFTKKIYELPDVTIDDVVSRSKFNLPEVRITYQTKDEFTNIARRLGIMEDLKAGVPRAAYRGVVSFMFNGQRVHVAPPVTWKEYDPTWN